MIIALFGATGQLGRSLHKDLATLGQVQAPTRQQLDLTDAKAVQQWLQQQPFDLLVNAAAMTQVDDAETSVELALALNHRFVQQLAEHAAAKQIWLLHFSTDYVFDGTGDQPWLETDNGRPLQQYGKSKWAGEQAILASGCLHLLIRTSWLYDSQGQNFLLTMLRLAQQTPTTLKIVADQIGAPTYTPELSAAVCHMLTQLLSMPTSQAKMRSGIYHLCASGHCSWFEFATAIFATASAAGVIDNQPALVAISSRELNRAAARPMNSRLDTQKVLSVFAVQLPHWRQQLERCVNALKIAAKTGK